MCPIITTIPEFYSTRQLGDSLSISTGQCGPL